MKVGYKQIDKDLLTWTDDCKNIKTIAIELVFTSCDLNCPFCPNINLPEQDIQTRIDNCIRNFKQILPKLTNTELWINITGTELFQQRFSDSEIKSIIDGIIGIDNLVKRFNRTPHYQITTHLLYNQHRLDQLIKVCKTINSGINTSFDFQGRFTNHSQINQFITNVYYAKQCGIQVTIDTVAHKLNIDKLMNQSDDQLVRLWKQLYNDFETTFVLWQNTGVDYYQVSDQLQIDFHKFCYDNYPKLANIQSLIDIANNIHRNIDCIRCIGIDDNIVKYRRCKDDNKQINKKKFQQNKQCYLCKYFNSCGNKCWCENTNNNVCWIKNVLEYIDENNQTIPIINYCDTNTRKQVWPDDNQHLEIIVSLFTECNLKCIFCGDRYRQLEKFSIEGLQIRLRHINTVLHTIQPKSVIFKIFGGELFQDKFDDTVFDYYQSFIDELKKICNQYNVEYMLDVSSNCVWKKVDRVFKFLKDNNIAIRCSYDQYGRFTKPYQKKLFIDNVFKLKQNGIDTSISAVLTKQLINCVINTSDGFDTFKLLYDNFPFAIDYYDNTSLLPETNNVIDDKQDLFQPNELEIGHFLLYCKQYYPNISIVKDLVDSYNNKSNVGIKHCSHGLAISNKIYWECCNLDRVTNQYVLNKGCVLCNHYSYCIGTCNRLFFNNHSKCHLKTFYDSFISK